MGVQLLTASCGTQGLEYTLSFFWKPPILIAWKPRADLDRDAMDPARDTVVSSLYKVRLVATVLCALNLLAAQVECGGCLCGKSRARVRVLEKSVPRPSRM